MEDRVVLTVLFQSPALFLEVGRFDVSEEEQVAVHLSEQLVHYAEICFYRSLLRLDRCFFRGVEEESCEIAASDHCSLFS